MKEALTPARLAYALAVLATVALLVVNVVTGQGQRDETPTPAASTPAAPAQVPLPTEPALEPISARALRGCLRVVGLDVKMIRPDRMSVSGKGLRKLRLRIFDDAAVAADEARRREVVLNNVVFRADRVRRESARRALYGCLEDGS